MPASAERHPRCVEELDLGGGGLPERDRPGDERTRVRNRHRGVDGADFDLEAGRAAYRETGHPGTAATVVGTVAPITPTSARVAGALAGRTSEGESESRECC